LSIFLCHIFIYENSTNEAPENFSSEHELANKNIVVDLLLLKVDALGHFDSLEHFPYKSFSHCRRFYSQVRLKEVLQEGQVWINIWSFIQQLTIDYAVHE